MNKMACVVLSAAVLCSLPVLLSAQSNFQGGLDFMVGFPHGEFADNLDVNGYGLDGKFLYNVPETPVSIGAGFSFLIYGRESREVPWSTTIPWVNVDVVTTNSIMYGYLMMRLQPQRGAFRPYVDAYGGFSLFTTDTEVQDQGDYEEIASSNNMRDFTSSYGVGGGIQFRVAGPRPFDERGDGGFESVYVEIGARYLKGGEAEYLKKNGVEVIEGDVIYDTKRSFTDIIMGSIGVIFTF
ncbi:hypothetical protein JXO52_12900 [bacterium]|nr:hypothetical protein [bacterium]